MAPSGVSCVCAGVGVVKCFGGQGAAGAAALCSCSGGLSTRVTRNILWPLPGLDTEMQRPGEGGVPRGAGTVDSVTVIPVIKAGALVGEAEWGEGVREALGGG